MKRTKKANSIGKVRLYKTPTKESPNKAVVSIPQSVQLNGGIKGLAISQTESLPPPKSVQDLLKTPKRTTNPRISGSQSVQETMLIPGYVPEIVAIGDIKSVVPPLEIETIVIPKGYIHLDDITQYQRASYLDSYLRTTNTFTILPGENNVPKMPSYQVNVINNELSVQVGHMVDSVRIYYRRKKPAGLPNQWVEWASMKNEKRVFSKLGKYEIIAVPYLENKPLKNTKQFLIENNEDFNLRWSHVQLRDNEYQIRMEGVLGDRVNAVEIINNGKIIDDQKLKINTDGETIARFNIANVALAPRIELKFRFLSKHDGIKRYVSESSYEFQRNYAKESIDFIVAPTSRKEVYKITILDPEDLLYSPTSEIDCFSGNEWDRAIQNQKLICKLEIVRHQEGNTTDYGKYFCNVSDGSQPVFLQSPPFKPSITKISGGYSFEFEDTQAFRDVANVDNPISSKPIAYEFRLVLWTAGIEQVLRSGLNYNYIIEQPVLIRGQRSTFKRNHSVWDIEHPMRRYRDIVPAGPKYSYLDKHTIYGRTMKGYILEGTLPVIENTNHIQVGTSQWNVLYHLDSSKDAMMEYPLVTFTIDIPYSSEPMIESINVSIDMNDDSAVDIGTWKASEKITVIDFMGYFLKRQQLSKSIDFSGPLGNARKAAASEPARRNLEKKQRNTPIKRKKAFDAVVRINKDIDKKIEGGIIKYIIGVKYIDGSDSYEFINVNIADRPKIPDEPEENIAFGPGNALLTEEFFADVKVDSFPAVASAVKKAEITKTASLRGRIRL